MMVWRCKDLSMIIVILAIAIIAALMIGLVIGYSLRKAFHEKALDQATQTAEGIIATAKKDAAARKKEALLEAKDESHRYRKEIESELKERRAEIQKQENRLLQREENLDRKDSQLDKREGALEQRESKYTRDNQILKQKQEDVSNLIQQQQDKLAQIAAMTQDDAKQLILKQTRASLDHELAVMIKDNEAEIKATADKTAKRKQFNGVLPIWFLKVRFPSLPYLTMK